MENNFGKCETGNYKTNKPNSKYKTHGKPQSVMKYVNPLQFGLKRNRFFGFLLGGGLGETPNEEDLKKSERTGQSKDDRRAQHEIIPNHRSGRISQSVPDEEPNNEGRSGFQENRIEPRHEFQKGTSGSPSKSIPVDPPLKSGGYNNVRNERAIVRNQLDPTGLARGYTGYSNTEQRGFAQNVDKGNSSTMNKTIATHNAPLQNSNGINKNQAQPIQHKGTRPVVDQKAIDKYLKELGTGSPCPCRNKAYGRMPVLESARRRWARARGSGIGGGRVGGGGAGHNIKTASTEAIGRGDRESEGGANKDNVASGSGGRRRNSEDSGSPGHESRERNSRRQNRKKSGS